MEQNKLRVILTQLAKQLIESQKQYDNIAAEVKNRRFKRLFENIANDRTYLLVDLVEEINELGGKIPYTRVNNDVSDHSRSLLSDEDPFTVIQERLSNESFLLNKYNEALEQDLPLSIRDLLNNHCKRIKKKYSEIRKLSEVFGAVAG